MSNEQRAHDLAIAMLSTALKPNPRESESKTRKNPYTTYLALYNDFLQNFNRDFRN